MRPPLHSSRAPRPSTAPVRPVRSGRRLPRFLLFCAAVLIAALCARLMEQVNPGAPSPTRPTSSFTGSLAIRLPGPDGR